MADPIRARSKVLLVKPEVTYGTDPTPTGDNAVLGVNFELMPMEGEDVSRDIEYPWLGNQEEFPTALRAVLSVSTELAPSGSTGVAPKWGPLMRACGVAENVVPDDDPGDGTVIYSPVSAAHESVTVYFWQGPTRHIFRGARGTGVIEVGAQGIPRVRWTLTGIWFTPTATAQTTPDFTGWQAMEIVTNAKTPTFEVNEVPLVMRSLTLNLGVEVDPRFLVGRHEIFLPDRAEEIAVTIEATPLGTFNPYALAETRTKVPIELVHGTDPGRITTIVAPTCQVRRPGAQVVNQGVSEWPLTLIPLPAAGNDQWSIVLT